MAGPEYLAFIEAADEGQHTCLMGATTYRMMSGFATQMPDDPGMAGMTAMPKVMFSSSLERPLSWANTELVETRTFDGQLQLLEYIPTVLDGPPGVGGSEPSA